MTKPTPKARPPRNDPRKDRIRDAVAAAAESRGLTAYALAQLTRGEVSEDAVKKFLDGRTGMTTTKAEHLLRALGLEVL